MTEHEHCEAVEALTYLCSCATNRVNPDNERIATVDLRNLFKISEEHMLSSICGKLLESIGITNPSFKNAVAMAQRKAVILNNEFSMISSAFESASIWYMPIKGAVLKDMYPAFAMREMADYDILFDSSRAEEVRVIMEELGFKTESYGHQNVDDYRKPPVSNFEMHRTLFGKQHDEKLYEYYGNVKDRLILDSGCRYKFTPEDFYVYLISHEYKHYSVYGTGLRSLLDTYVFLQKNNLDMDYVTKEIEKLGIREFEQQNRSLAMALFDKNALTDDNKQMLSYILASGTYGKFNHSVENVLRRDGDGKLEYLRRRIIGPLKKNDVDRKRFKERYATFFNHPILLPFLPFYRLFRALKKSPKRIKAEAKALKNAEKATR